MIPGQTYLQGFSIASDLGIAPGGSQMLFLPGERNCYRAKGGEGDVTSDFSRGYASSGSEEISQVELDRSALRKKRGSQKAVCGGETLRKRTDCQDAHVKREALESSFGKESFKEVSCTHGVGSKVGKKRLKRKKRIGSESNLKTRVCVDSLDSAQTVSSDSESGEKWEAANKKRKKVGQDASSNAPWTGESVQFLFETYAAVRQRLWEESNGEVKYQKKWTPILRAMEQRFGKHFSKKQCQSKYWSVRRECTDYRFMSAKIARSDPSWNHSIVGRELLKPKFYDAWYKVSGKDKALQPEGEGAASHGKEGPTDQALQIRALNEHAWRCQEKEDPSSNYQVEDCGSALREMQRLMQVQLQASEKREEAMKYRTELMMEVLTQHMEHVEKRVGSFEEGRQPQLYLLERINHKLEKVLDGFTTLSENLSTISFRISKCMEAQ